MGIFDFLTRGPELSRLQARWVSETIAIMLVSENLSPRDLTMNLEMIMEKVFSVRYPDHSITSEQTRQIIKFSLYMCKNHKDYIKEVNERGENYLENNVKTYGNIKDEPPNSMVESSLSLFKDE